MTRKTVAKTERFNLRIGADLKRRAEAAAAADHRSLASLVEKLLDDYTAAFEHKPSEKRK